MTTAIQFRRGTSDEHFLFTGLEGEITVDTTKSTAVIHNNKTAGGIPLAREDLTNIPMQKIIDKGIAKSDMTNVATEDIAQRGIAKQDMSNVSTENIALRGIMKNDCSNATHLATEDKIGPTQFATEEEALNEEETSKSLHPKNASKLIKKHIKLPLNYITGLKITKFSDTSIQIDTGCARSNDDKFDLYITESIIKNINTNWVNGSNEGSLKEGETLTTETNYYVYLILTNENITDIMISSEELNTSDTIIALRKIGLFRLNTNLYIDETSIIDANDKNLPNSTTLTIPFSNIKEYKIPLNGTAFIECSARNTAATIIYLNKTKIAYFKNDNSSWVFATIPVKVKQNDIISITAANDTNKTTTIYLSKERSFENV